ncbi:hypothetical protein [Candidatus Electronema sp. JM]|uniref:hypothetical protein n=1 Tax=Candidatus Electronema sp. JM TaxID=3401571 RepID=UPI003AA7DAA3
MIFLDQLLELFRFLGPIWSFVLLIWSFLGILVLSGMPLKQRKSKSQLENPAVRPLAGNHEKRCGGV